MVRDAYENREFDVVAINYRGLADCPLSTPVLYESGALKDIQEPMKYIKDKYCNNNGKKLMAVGCSFGGNILANILGKESDDCFLTAACCV